MNNDVPAALMKFTLEALASQGIVEYEDKATNGRSSRIWRMKEVSGPAKATLGAS
jgi:hypothetical protein